ncbi:MAG TPA: hypothetical protein VLA34_08705, partial [Candidatus Krumholzibacterium sp.]|nr:hypothetical protein [Candidatus Krumholzibacterium sp.]
MSLLVIFGSVAVLVIGVLLYFASGPGERLIKSRVEQILSEVTGSDVEIGLLETDLFSRLVLADIRLSTESSTDSTFHLNVTGIRADYDLFRLLKKTIAIRSVRVEGMLTVLRRREDGTIDIPFPQRQEKEGDIPSASSWKIELQEIRIEDSSVRYFDRALNGGMSCSTRIDAVILLRGGATYDFRFSGAGGQYSDSLISVDDVNTYIAGRVDAGMAGEDPPPGIFTIDSLSITSLGLNLTGSGGSVKREAGTDITGDLRLDCDLGELIGSIGGTLSGRAEETTGLLGLDASIGGRIDDPIVEWTIGIPSLRSGKVDLRDTWCRGVLTPRSIRVDSLFARCFGGDLTGSGSVSFDSIGTARVDLSGSGFSLVELHRTIDERDIDYSGSAGMDISIEGPATRPMDWKVEISAELNDLVYSGRPTGPLILGISMENGVFGLDAKQGINTMLAKGDIREDLLDIGFSLDVREAAPLAALAGVAGFDGEAFSRGRISGDLSSPSIEASVTGRKILYRSIPVESLDLEVRYAEGVFSADNFVFSGA